MKNIQDFLKVGSSQSMMRLGFSRSVNSTIICVLTIAIGAVIGFILGIVLNRDLAGIASCVTAFGVLSGAIATAMNIPAFGGKAAQAKFELENKAPEQPAEGK